MKLVILLLVCYSFTADCFPKKTIAPIDKNANIDFINMEAGGPRPKSPPPKPVAPAPQANTIKPAAPTTKPVQVSAPAQSQNTPVKAPEPMKPVAIPTTPVPAKPTAAVKPTQIQPKPVNPPPATNPITTPGPGSVKQLINFYDSQGKASPIRPYSYSQAVKQG